MNALPADVAEAELGDWLTTTIGAQITNEYDTATQLLAAFDFRAKDSTSLNNPHQIAACLDNPPTTWSRPSTPLTASAAAQHLLEAFRITRKPANYQALFVDLPMPVVVTRHQCPYCRRFTRASIAPVHAHMTRCWKNPALRSCKTCVHHQDGSHPEDDESCTRTDGPEYEDYQFPVLHCPLWETQ